jgi:uncharacterized membrane protein
MAGSHWSTSRIEAFSDGVFAIAITLLVLDISVPESDFDHLWRGIADQWPSYLGYVTSFTAIGGMWLSHHGIFRRLQFANDRVLRINLLLLMAVGFLPFPTRLAAEAIGDDDAERAAVIFYGITLLLISVLFRALWEAILRDRELLRPDVSPEEVADITRRATPNIAFYVAATALAWARPTAAAVLYLVIAVAAVIRAPGSGRAPRRVRSSAG